MKQEKGLTEVEFYQKLIIEKTQKINNVDFLRKIYTILNQYIKKG